MRPHKSAKETHRSLDQSLKSTLPRRPLVPPETMEHGIRKQQDQLSN